MNWIRKIGSLSLALVLILGALLPSAFASPNGGLLRGMSANDGGVLKWNGTDGNSSTYELINAGLYLDYILDSPKNIKGYFLQSNVSAYVKIQFYDSNNVLLGEKTQNANLSSANGKYYFAVDYPNTKKLRVINTGTSNYRLYEVEVTDSVVINPYEGTLNNGIVAQYSSSSYQLTSQGSSFTITTNYTENYSTANNYSRWFQFAEPQIFDTYSLYTSVPGTLSFYDSNKTLLSSITPTNTGERVKISPVSNVTYVEWKNTSGTTAYFTTLHVMGDKTAPGNVNGIQQSATNAEVNLQWNNPSDSDFAGTKIYRNNELIATLDKTKNSFKDTSIQPGTTYEYKITTFDNDQNESSGVTVSITTLTPDWDYVSDVTNVTTSIFDDRVKITWTNPPEQEFVEVRIFKNGVLHAVATTPATQFTDYDLSSNTTYSYLLRSRSSTGYMSPGVTVTATTTGSPATPKNFYGVPTDGQVNIYWDGTESMKDYNFIGYHIYQNGQRITTTPIAATTYTVSGLTNDQTYQFEVTAIDDLNNESPKSNQISLTPTAPTPPKVNNLRAAETKKHYIRFTWDHDPTAEKYIGQVKIKRLQATSMGFSLATAQESEETTQSFETTENEYTVETEPGDEVTFSVSAYNSEFGEQEPASTTAHASMFDTPEFNGQAGFTPKDLFDSAISLASNFWLFLVLGLSFVLAPWIYHLIRKSVTTAKGNGEGTEEKSRSQGRELNRDIRQQLRKKEDVS